MQKGNFPKMTLYSTSRWLSVEIMLIVVIMLAVVDLANEKTDIWQWISSRTRRLSVSLRVLWCVVDGDDGDDDDDDDDREGGKWWISCRKRTCSVSLRVSILRATITGMRRSTTDWKNFKFKIDRYIPTNNCKFHLFMQILKKKLYFKVQVKKAWTIFDKNGDGKLTPQEFRCIVLELGKKSNFCEKGGWNHCFQKDGLDWIAKWSRTAIWKFCKNTILNEIYFFRWMTRQSFLSEKQIDLVFQKFDIDGDGSLSFREFKK